VTSPLRKLLPALYLRDRDGQSSTDTRVRRWPAAHFVAVGGPGR
jgi:hypothetical protein